VLHWQLSSPQLAQLTSTTISQAQQSPAGGATWQLMCSWTGSTSTLGSLWMAATPWGVVALDTDGSIYSCDGSQQAATALPNVKCALTGSQPVYLGPLSGTFACKTDTYWSLMLRGSQTFAAPRVSVSSTDALSSNIAESSKFVLRADAESESARISDAAPHDVARGNCISRARICNCVLHLMLHSSKAVALIDYMKSRCTAMVHARCAEE
jgi:hypothetical protein